MTSAEGQSAGDALLEAHFARAERLAAELEGAAPLVVLERALKQEFPGEIALVSSFGAESVILLHLAASIDPTTPVIFIDTGKHFVQTLDYRDALVERLGLTSVTSVGPDEAAVRQDDPKGDLWKRDPDACCALRKVAPNEAALAPYRAWISGRKRYHGAVRAQLPVVEHDGLHFKVNPLVAWGAEELAQYIAAHDLPAHPLVAQGYPSIGCWPCTSPTEGTDARAGRWAGSGKTECGIHRPAPARRLVF